MKTFVIFSHIGLFVYLFVIGFSRQINVTSIFRPDGFWIISAITFPHQQSEDMLWKQFENRSSFFWSGTFWEEAGEMEQEADPLIEDDKNKNLIYQHQLYQHHHLSFCFAHVMFIMSVSRKKGILDVRLTFHSWPLMFHSFPSPPLARLTEKSTKSSLWKVWIN